MNYFQIKIYGIVQGVGFRPFIARLFDGCCGSVKNCGSYVTVLLHYDEKKNILRRRDKESSKNVKEKRECTGESSNSIKVSLDRADELSECIREQAPERAEIVDVQIENISESEFEKLLSLDIPEKGEEGKDFFIARSPEKKPANEPVFIPPDLAICDDCARELYDPSNRRYLHPFINCTQCGPRLTIIDSLPYDRPRTSMHKFPMCPSCEKEYTTPSDRRYDAQPVCCNDCGPRVSFLSKTNAQDFCDGDAITQARAALINGEIIAVKGIGGFHLYCDATNEKAVEELRKRKVRPAKPFAVMAHDMETVRAVCKVEYEEQEGLLTGHRKPIVLLKKRTSDVLKAVNEKEDDSFKLDDESKNKFSYQLEIAHSVAPGNPSLGVMLPYAPLQLLLFSYPDGLDEKMPQVLVATSANRSGGIICRTEEEVEKTLGNVCDGILSHDREILTRADDSVVDFFERKPYMIRRSRGYAPLPVTVEQGLFKQINSPDECAEVLAFGGELKNTFCIGKGRLLYPSSYIGDLSDVNSDKALEETVDRFLRMLDAHPSVVVCDKHPRYRSRACAEAYVKNNPGTKLIEVQHHYAHVLSVMAENHFYKKVIGVAYDGTGYGDDGTIWGGEIFLCDLNGCERKWHISPFIFSGGDVAAREGFRVALSMLFDKYENTQDICDIIDSLGLCDVKYVKPLKVMHERMMNSVVSTSCGRLFDAVSAVLGICRSQSFEGEASMGLQFAAERYMKRKKNQGEDTSPEIHSTAELFYRIVDEKLRGKDSGELAYFFHKELAKITVDEAVQIMEESGCETVALSGGCFQNTLLLALTKSGLEEKGFTVLTAHEVPPNDGGISLGQCLKGMHDLRKDIFE
jgi:hydrogenase maturation protein HypF